MSLYLGGIGHFKIYLKSSGPSGVGRGGRGFINPVSTLLTIYLHSPYKHASQATPEKMLGWKSIDL